ncbi:MAG: hypothetical protein MJE66_08350, partial [Proteobacteria bacterium]|nr:hypothetical protein [Pseudomonadota bacterium]
MFSARLRRANPIIRSVSFRRRATLLVAKIEPRTSLDQKRGAVSSSACTGDHQRGVAVAVRRVERRADVEQPTHDVELAGGGRVVEGLLAALVG